MSIILDPAIRILPEDHHIFVLHPGTNKRFYADFEESKSVFLDIPAINLDIEPEEDTENLRNQLRMSKKISMWHRAGAALDDEPSRNPDDYAVNNPSPAAPKLFHAINDLYSLARSGDLILVPGKGYNSTVLIGEIEGDFDPNFKVESTRYPGEYIPARRVKWLPTSMAKGQFNRRLIKLMQNRQAIIKITNEDDRREVYKVVYGDYVWNDTSGNLIRVTKDEIDLNDLNKAVDLTNYFACQYLALKDGKLKEFLSLPFNDAIDAFYDKKYFGGVNVEIHSPGYFGRPMKLAMMAGYVSAMLALSGANVSAQEAQNVSVVNSANHVESICDKELEADLRESMEMYASLHLWKDVVCARREATKKTVGLQTQVTVKKK